MNNQLINLLESFISFPSTDSNAMAKKECLDWVQAAFFSDCKASLQRGEYQGSSWLYLKADAPELLVFAHIDVVPAPDALFHLRVEGDTAYGRGVSDMKGNILPFLMAYHDACKEGESPTVSILLTSDEEVAGRTIPHLLKEGIVTAPVAFTPDSNHKGIVCEHKGVVWAELVTKGKGGHGAYPWDTENPVWLLGAALEKLRNAFLAGGHDDWQITVSPTMLKGSDARNQVAKEARCGLDIRYTPENYASGEEALKAVAAVLPEGCSLRSMQEASPLKTDPNHPTVLLYREIASRILEREIPYKREHGGTDARYFSEAGIPAFLFGPEGGGIHSDDEWVSIASLQKHYDIYREWLFHYR